MQCQYLWICLALVLATLFKPGVAAPMCDHHHSKQNQWVNLIAGGVAGSIAGTITMPLEVVKTQLQSSRIARKTGPLQIAKRIMQNDGVYGFFKGLEPMLVGIIPTKAIYFWAYAASKEKLSEKLGNSPLNHLLSAFAAGITSNTIMNPLWMMKTRFQIIADPTVGQKTFRNYGDVARVIWKEEGPAGFFKGLTASYVGCFEGAIQWIVYEKLKTAFTARNGLSSSISGHNLANGNAATVGTDSGKSALLSRTKTLPLSPLTRSSKTSSSSGNGNQQAAPSSQEDSVTKQSVHPAQLFLAAAVAKFTAIVATYPHEVVRTRLREQAVSGVFKYRGFVGTLRTIAREEGTRGLYGGMGMHLLRSVPNTAIMFLSFELVKKWVDQQPTLQQQQKQQQGDSDGTRSAAVVAKGLTVHGRKK